MALAGLIPRPIVTARPAMNPATNCRGLCTRILDSLVGSRRIMVSAPGYKGRRTKSLTFFSNELKTGLKTERPLGHTLPQDLTKDRLIVWFRCPLPGKDSAARARTRPQSR